MDEESVQKLKRLKSLLDSGAITAEDFRREKDRILGKNIVQATVRKETAARATEPPRQEKAIPGNGERPGGGSALFVMLAAVALGIVAVVSALYLLGMLNGGGSSTMQSNGATTSMRQCLSSQGYTGGTCPGNIVFDASVNLTSDVKTTGSITINSGVTVITNGHSMLAGGAFSNYGNISTGSSPKYRNFSSSYGGSGGGGQGAASGGGAAGFSTLAYGGRAGGGGTGGSGSTPSPPSLSASLIASWYASGIQNYLAGAWGGYGYSNGCCPGGSGAYGLFIEAYGISAGSINAGGGAGGGTCSATALGGGGGGGAVLLAYGNGGLSNTTNINNGGGHGAPLCNRGAGTDPNWNAYGAAGSPGLGSALTFSYGTSPPVPP